MNITDPRPEFSRPLSFDEVQLLMRRARVERSRYVASALRSAAIAVRRFGRHTMRRLASSTRPHDLSGRPA